MLHETGIVALSDALRSNWQGNEYTCENEDYSTLVWHDGNKDPKPTEEEVNAAIASLQAEYDAQDYARKRIAEYPQFGDQLDKIYHEGIDKWKEDMIKPVKDKHPKT